jgi:hypothetical protein
VDREVGRMRMVMRCDSMRCDAGRETSKTPEACRPKEQVSTQLPSNNVSWLPSCTSLAD